ncbi:MAG: hypothetical protein IJV89_10290 [Lentisphaeria bacterium]|nr:hypothetical protein [Lentisphaeria bacterium]
MKGKRWIKLITVTVIAELLLAAGYGYGVIAWAKYRANKVNKSNAQLSKADPDRTYRLKRADLILGLRLGGSVSASKKHKLSLQANYSTKLLSIVDENTKVKAGDVLAVFETDALLEKIDDLKTSYANMEKELVLAIENAKVQERGNEVDMKVADDRLNQAEAALRKYLRLERANNRKTYDLKISSAETSLATAQQDYDNKKQEIAEAGVTDDAQKKEDESALNDLKNKIDTAQNTLDSARMDRKAFKRYDDPIKLLRLYNELEQAKLNREKVRISTSSTLVQRNKQVDNLRSNMRRVRNQLEKYESYVPMMKLVAPADGIVIYADPDRRWGNPDIKPGMDVWKRLVILTIPEMNNLMVDFDLPETYRSRTKVGDRVIITPDSLPALKLYGKIGKIATLPVNQNSWDSASPKVYNSRIVLDRQDPQLVNGMSVQIEVISRVIKNTLFIPVEAVFERQSSFYVYRRVGGAPKETPVSIGESNDNFVQITDGLEEGDVVYLYRPYDKKQSE